MPQVTLYKYDFGFEGRKQCESRNTFGVGRSTFNAYQLKRLDLSSVTWPILAFDHLCINFDLFKWLRTQRGFHKGSQKRHRPSRKKLKSIWSLRFILAALQIDGKIWQTGTCNAILSSLNGLNRFELLASEQSSFDFMWHVCEFFISRKDVVGLVNFATLASTRKIVNHRYPPIWIFLICCNRF